MQSPALNQKEYERKLDAITKCGTNRGPHDYIPIAWLIAKESKHVSTLMCRTCLHRVHVETIYNHFPHLGM
jgi:hypothetical protein